MSESVESSVAQVGIRDFLFYVLPGFVLLAGIFAWAGITLKDIQTYGDVSSSVLAILLSYSLGQFIYAYSYPLRWLLEKIRPFKLEKDDSENFQKMYLKATENHGAYFEVEVFRYRTFARFCSLMIIPIIFSWSGAVFGKWLLDDTSKILVTVFSFLGCVNFIIRYYRYEGRYRKTVLVLGKSMSSNSSRAK